MCKFDLHIQKKPPLFNASTITFRSDLVFDNRNNLK